MKILHSAVATVPLIGVFNQMNDERKAADVLGINWESKLFYPPDIHPNGGNCPKSNLPHRYGIFPVIVWKTGRWLITIIKYYLWLYSRKDVDVYVLRYSAHDPFQTIFVWVIRKPVYFVHHTFEVTELTRNKTIAAIIKGFVEKICGSASLLRAHGIVGVTEEIVSYEVSRSYRFERFRYVYPNGILYDRNPVQDLRKGKQEWLFIASHFYSWHGLDRLLSALSGSTIDIVLHIVGTVDARDHLVAKSDPRVILHGLLSSDQIIGLAARCSIGLSSFALDRKGMKEACTLKVREYLRMGLPVVAGHDDIFPSDFLYFRNLGNNIDEILSFAEWCGGISREEVFEAARPYIDKVILLSSFSRAISEDIESTRIP